MNSKDSFPSKLYIILDVEDPEIVRWVRNGFAFKVFDNRRFQDDILPRYYRHSKIESFQRQLNLYGFKRVSKGEDAGAYYHPLMVEGRSDWANRLTKEPMSESLYREIMEYAEMRDPTYATLESEESRPICSTASSSSDYGSLDSVAMSSAQLTASTSDEEHTNLKIVCPALVTPSLTPLYHSCVVEEGLRRAAAGIKSTTGIKRDNSGLSTELEDAGGSPNKRSDSDLEDLLNDSELLNLLL